MATTLKTVVGLFDDLGEARNAVQELFREGFSRDDVNLIANASADEYGRYFDKDGRYKTSDSYAATAAADSDHSGVGTGASIGAVLGGLGGLLFGMALLPVPGIGPIVAAGPITSALVGAVGGAVAGGIIGALTNTGVPETHAPIYAEGVRRGGTLVIVKTDTNRIDRAKAVLNRYNPVNVEQRASDWRRDGWQSYDPSATPYSANQIATERARYGVGTGTGFVGGATGAAHEGSLHAVGTGAGAAGGAVAGAAVGSVVPVVGTTAGAVIGGVAGGVGGHEMAKTVNPRPGDPM